MTKTLQAFLAAFAIAGAFQQAARADTPIVDDWRFVLRRPPKGWRNPDFDDSSWLKGSGGFGEWDTPGARIGTVWNTNDIWLRKSFELTEVPEAAALLIHHDEDAQVFVNGKPVGEFQRWSTEYQVVRLTPEQRSNLKQGKNVLAVHCHQTNGGQFIDVHVVDAENVPQLPPPKPRLEPFKSHLITRWGKNVTADNAWREYPRPQLRRNSWANLNGHWDYAVTARDQMETPKDWEGNILVPFCLESKLGGVQRILNSRQALWYRRSFQCVHPENERVHLNFEAVDYRCQVFVNGKLVGSHVGGNTPFSFDISKAVVDGENELVVRVEDDTEQYQLHGKQTLNPRGIWYTQVSGIWQTVWLEQTQSAFIEDLHLSTDPKTGEINVAADVDGTDNWELQVTVIDGVKKVADGTGKGVTVTVPNAKLWTPSAPHLYDLDIRLLVNGQEQDKVRSYIGIRSVGKARDANGHLQFTLNGEPIFHWGPLDQGWWPDGLLTPPSDEGMLFDIEYLKAAGFNMIRKHIKVEPRRYYYHCDRLGMMVWQDQVSSGNNPPWTRLDPNPKDADWPDAAHEQYMVELEAMIDELENHPAIVAWVPFNEAWGQHRTVEVGEWTVKRDASRLVNIASGGNFWPVGDVADHHAYPHPDFPFNPERYKDFVRVIGEFGGHGYPVRDHLWDANRRNWGYGDLPKTEEEYKARYVRSLEILNGFRKDNGISGGVYTQTTDVEGEINGLMTYDREVIKIPASDLAELHKQLFAD
ncbi:MAG: beta galactosidase jelly roll domain-containing protein [Planctomycetaceae bacterium]|nr:beta galactosidase jelly roll domain-containing protein [Planctomycetaceae bacterium]MCB9954140.1 beta galactosidase jelly roll domain-containing protein [Planctomycetaceae bacterium]